MAGKQYKVKLSDGIELGPVDADTLKSWYEGGTIKKDSQVLAVGTKQWKRLMDAVSIDRWQMPEPAGHKGGKGAKATGEKRKERPAFVEPPQRWRTYLASGLFVLAAAGTGYLAFFPQLWLASLRLVYWPEIALVLLALGLSLARGWEPARMLVRTLVLLATFALFPLAGILWVEGVRGAGLLVLACAWLLGSGFFALLARARQTPLVTTACVLLILAGAGGIAYFGVLQQHAGAGAAASAR
jgi:hypothetical protein